MAEIIKIYREEIPAMRFIGKKYDDFGNWGEWFANGWFDEIERAMGGVDSILSIWESGGGYVGLEQRGEREERRDLHKPFQHTITATAYAAPANFSPKKAKKLSKTP